MSGALPLLFAELDASIERRRRRPRLREGTVRRDRLVRRLAHVPLTLLVAPAGYGKTTLLEHWLEHDPRHVAWLSIDEADDDPDRLVASVSVALDNLVPSDSLVELANTLEQCDEPFVLVLD